MRTFIALLSALPGVGLIVVFLWSMHVLDEYGAHAYHKGEGDKIIAIGVLAQAVWFLLFLTLAITGVIDLGA